MSKTTVSTKDIRNVVQRLNKLKEECIAEEKKMKSKDKGKGKVSTEMAESLEVLYKEWAAFQTLIDKSILFLSDTANAYDESDRASASNVKNGGSR